MNKPVFFNEKSKSHYLSSEQVEELGAKIEAIRREVMESLNEKDAQYIYKIRNFVRYSEIASRGMLMFAGWVPPVWLLATGLLGISKIVENMELGHNVMHGQFDWLNDPSLNGANYDWDTMATGQDWKYTHNYVHHTYTNIVGMDHDVGYGLIRVSDSQKWEPRFLFNIPLAIQLMVFFEWYVGIQRLHLEDVIAYKTKTWAQVWEEAADVRKKMKRQILKDYIFFPLIAGPNAIPVFTGNAVANVIRSLWASAVIFNGHFTEDASDEEMFDAVRKAKAEEFIPQLVDLRGQKGYDAFVGERGVKLSGGQRQRIAIARVFLKDAPILILDEATSALDSEVEAAIQSSLDELMQGKTVIAIAHRLSTIAQMDRLIVLDQGRIAEQGTHDELVALNGIYAHLWQRQTGGFLLEQS
jgi:fatty acid desaturase